MNGYRDQPEDNAILVEPVWTDAAVGREHHVRLLVGLLYLARRRRAPIARLESGTLSIERNLKCQRYPKHES